METHLFLTNFLSKYLNLPQRAPSVSLYSLEGTATPNTIGSVVVRRQVGKNNLSLLGSKYKLKTVEKSADLGLHKLRTHSQPPVGRVVRW